MGSPHRTLYSKRRTNSGDLEPPAPRPISSVSFQISASKVSVTMLMFTLVIFVAATEKIFSLHSQIKLEH